MALLMLASMVVAANATTTMAGEVKAVYVLSDNIVAANDSILPLAVIAAATIFLLYEFIGLTLKSTGDTPDMSCAQGVDVDPNKVVGLAIAHGNRLIMMQDGHIIVDVEGEEKKKLTVEDLLKLFARASGQEFANDRAILA